jgi:hypothetical protein
VRWCTRSVVGEKVRADANRLISCGCSMPASAIWISEGQCFASSDRYAPIRQNPGATVFQRIKEFMHNAEFCSKAEKFGVSLEEIYRTFFDTILSALLTAQHNNLIDWVNRANENVISDQRTQLDFTIARPSGLAEEQTRPVLTALWKCGNAFGTKLGLSNFITRISDLPESEMALRASAAEAGNIERIEAVFDFGGNTTVSKLVHLCVKDSRTTS